MSVQTSNDTSKPEQAMERLKEEIDAIGGPAKWCGDAGHVHAFPKFCSAVIQCMLKRHPSVYHPFRTQQTLQPPPGTALQPPPVTARIRKEILSELFLDVDPFEAAQSFQPDWGYPHTNIRPEIIRAILKLVRPSFWLEAGSMLGNSAIRTADAVKELGLDTTILCVDPFTGDVNMWAWEREIRAKGQWSFLQLKQGRPSTYERFMANVYAARHADIVIAVPATSIVGFKLIGRLLSEGRLSQPPQVIYLDSAHEKDETFIELQEAWNILDRGGILLGDDWGWDPVREDVSRFAGTVRIAPCELEGLGWGDANNGVRLHSRSGQWVLCK